MEITRETLEAKLKVLEGVHATKTQELHTFGAELAALGGGIRMLRVLIEEYGVPTLTEDELKELVGAESIEFHEGEPPNE